MIFEVSEYVGRMQGFPCASEYLRGPGCPQGSESRSIFGPFDCYNQCSTFNL